VCVSVDCVWCGCVICLCFYLCLVWICDESLCANCVFSLFLCFLSGVGLWLVIVCF